MVDKTLHAVTGAFGYSGKYIASRLLAQGQPVITLTNSAQRTNPFGGQVQAHPFNFDRPDELARSLENVAVLYNTYWVRFNHARFTHQDAVQNTLTLFKAARQAGVPRIVHVSITNPSAQSALEYFRGKAILEQALVDSGIPHTILRPTVIFGKEDILINNIAWVLRHLPVFGVFGDGQYRLQPIYVEDLAELAVSAGAERQNQVIDAIGPETFTYRELVGAIAQRIGVRRLTVAVPPRLGFWAGRLVGALVGDVIITREEIEGLMADLLYVSSPPAGHTRLTDWISAHAQTLGRRYTSELARRVDRQGAYASN
jgi:NADH dehydrogenase